MDPDGDKKLRDSYHAKLLQMLNFTPRAVIDLGCASGLSTFGLHQVSRNVRNCFQSFLKVEAWKRPGSHECDLQFVSHWVC